MITGHTKVLYMIAHPIAHVRTPEILNPLMQARGIDAVMVPVHYTPQDFARGWEAMLLPHSRLIALVMVKHR